MLHTTYQHNKNIFCYEVMKKIFTTTTMPSRSSFKFSRRHLPLFFWWKKPTRSVNFANTSILSFVKHCLREKFEKKISRDKLYLLSLLHTVNIFSKNFLTKIFFWKKKNCGGWACRRTPTLWPGRGILNTI